MSIESSAQLRAPGPDIIREQVVLEEHALARDGSFAIAVRRSVADDRYVSHLWLVPLPAGDDALPAEPRQLTDGATRDRRAAISPDGARAAFTRRPAGDDRAAARLVVLELDGAAGREPVAITPEGVWVTELAWSPDGRWLAYVAEADPQRFLVGPVGAGRAPLARVIREMDWRYDDQGYLDRRAQLFLVPAAGDTVPRQLTAVSSGVSSISWRPDGGEVAFVADPRPDADRHPRTSIWAVATTAGDGVAAGAGVAAAGDVVPREVLALRGPVAHPAWSPDGRWIAGVGIDESPWYDDVSPTLFVGPADGTRPAACLAPDLDRPVCGWVAGDLVGHPPAGTNRPAWDGADGIVALVVDRGRVHPWRFPVDPATGRSAGDPLRLAQGDVAGEVVRVAAGRVTVTATIDADPPELGVVATDGTVRAVTRLGSAWMRGLAWPELRVVEAPGPGGPIETWIASPAGAGDAALPTVVDVHGGPLGAWAPAPSIEVVLLCARGYRVVLPNIRGSASYGGEWIRPQLGDWGGADADDVHAALDHVIELGLADPDRLGVLGLSYGGFMVNWLVGTSDRFRAAVSENGVTNQVAAWANSDEGPEYCRSARMGDPTTPGGVELLWRQSPLRHVANVRTPLLLLQGEADHRCAPADNEQLFVALRWLGREVEYVLYPEEPHGYKTSGRVDRRIDRMTRMLDWFDRHLEG